MSRQASIFIAIPSLVFFACGSEPAEPVTGSAPPPPTGGEVQASADESPPPDPWADLDEAGLRDYVTREARARIAEVDPDLDLSQLAAWQADPSQAPELSGRVVERLFDLAAVDLAAGRDAEAASMVRLIRARARNRNSAFSGNTFLCIAARRGAGEDTAAQEEAVKAAFRELPPERFGSATVVFQLFQTPEQLSARVEQSRGQLLSLETASTVLLFDQVFPDVVEHRDRYLAAIEAVRAEHARRRPPRDYRFSTVDLSRARDTHPVVVGVFDVGTNPALFEEQLYTNDHEQENGRDDDGNGLIDDIHGVVSDGDAPNTALLFEPDPQTLEQYKPFLRGIMDLRAGLASTEAAQRVLELLRSVTDAAEMDALEQRLDAVGEWAHGTHVAGITLAGIPQARLAIFRSAWAGEARTYWHRGPTDAELEAERRNMRGIADFVNRHGVKVVNASLGFGQDYVEDQLRYERDRYPDDAAVRARAEQVHAHRRESWRQLFELCPGTLFVVAAGNSNRDVVEYEDIPASMEASNLLVIGAVDRHGKWATFTNSNPERVQVFDHGVEVDSLIPSGERVPLSGTSMASPNVANLAAKIYSVSPDLTPAQVITIITETGDPIAAPFNGRIANEQRALVRARRERGR